MASDGKRVTAIDTLRGLSMIFMIFGAAIWWHSGLPGWMFHCQTPPPDYAFHPEVRGITYMDLVFPFFLFSMGAAFPFALRKRLERGESRLTVIKGLFRRWITLVLFSLLLGNTGLMQGWDGPDTVKGVFALAVWGGFFLSLWRTERRIFPIAGYVLLIAALAFEKFVCHIPLSLHTTDVIIMILAWVALLGGLIWLVTRDNLRLRGLIFLFVAAVRAVCAYTDTFGFLALPESARWIFDWGFLQYLLIAIPASMAGDLLAKRNARENVPATGAERRTQSRVVAASIALIAVVIQPWLLYERAVWTDIGLTAFLAVVYGAVTLLRNRHGQKDRRPGVGTADLIAFAGFLLTLAGLGFDFLDGGIAKDYCNLSYLFTTCGMASVMTAFFLHLESAGWKSRLLADCGQNPMIAYTICWYVLSPLLYGIGLLGLLDSLCPDSPFWAVVRGITVTAAMCASTAFFTRRKIFWRS